MSISSTRTPRRQADRRAETIARLLDATVDCLVDTGYAATSTLTISARAGVSQGALFRHFPTRHALMAAVAEHVGDGLIASYAQRFRALSGLDDRIALALRLLRENCRAKINQAWFELLMAARSDTELKAALAPIWARNAQLTRQIAAQIFPEWAATTDRFPVVIDLLVTLFHGEAVDSFVQERPQADADRFAMAELICELLARHYGPATGARP